MQLSDLVFFINESELMKIEKKIAVITSS